MPPTVREGLPSHLPALWRYALKLTRDHADAADLVQDTCLKALHFEHTYTEGNLEGWLMCILHNLHISARRKIAQRAQKHILVMPMVEEDWQEEGNWSELSSPPEQETHIEYVETAEVLSGFTDHFRLPIVLSAVHGLMYEEIAAALGIPKGTVRSRLSRARKKLRLNMTEEYRA